jgi:hypothetical protein
MIRARDRREDFLAILGLGPAAGEEDIRTAYRRLAMRYHPDSSGDPSTARRFERVVRAYKILTTKPFEQPLVRAPLCKAVAEARGDLFALGRILRTDPDPRNRAHAARELGLSGKSAAYVFLRPALYDASESVAIAAVRAAALIGAAQAEGEVAALYSRSSSVMRRKILESAQGTGERLFRQTIEAAKHDPEPSLALMAMRLEHEQRFSREA